MNDAIDRLLTNKGYKRLNDGSYRGECPFRENHISGNGRKSMFFNPYSNTYHCFSCRYSGVLSRLLRNRLGASIKDTIFMGYDDYESSTEKKIVDLPIIDFREQPQFYLDRGISREVLRKHRVGRYFDDDIEVATIPIYKNSTHIATVYVKNTKPIKQIWATPYEKDEVLYAFDNTTDESYIIIVEGFADAWRLKDWGYNASALLGTSMSTQQYNLINKYKSYLALDNDKPGIDATDRIVKEFNTKNWYIIPYSSPDPDTDNEKSFFKSFANPILGSKILFNI